MIYTKAQAKALEADFGPLEWMDCTIFGKPEGAMILGTSLCAYCKMPNPTGRCGKCGASALRDGESCS